MPTPFGVSGCNCWYRDWEDGRTEAESGWQVNARCQFHAPEPDPWPERPSDYVCVITEEKERGVLATVRRWGRRLGAWWGVYLP